MRDPDDERGGRETSRHGNKVNGKGDGNVEKEELKSKRKLDFRN